MEQPEKRKDSPKASAAAVTHPTTDPHVKGQPEEEFRQTWKMKPKISKKLPSAFCSMQKGGKKEGPGEKRAEKRGAKIDSIKEAVDAEEYKQMQNLLSPIVMDNQRREEMQKGLNKIYEPTGHPKKATKLEPLDQQQVTRKEDDKKKHHSKHKDPAKQPSTGLPPAPDFGFKKTTLPSSQVRLEEMITLSVLKGTRNTGSVKKMLHAPSLKLYAVKEIPLTNREVRIVLKEWISLWQNAQGEASDKLCNVFGTFWNVPEGCVSIVMEHLNAGSLENLLESAGALPEQVLLELATKLLACMQEVHGKLGVAHGCIVPSQILFDQGGKVKLSLGVAHKLNSHGKEGGTGSLGYYGNGGGNSGSSVPFSLYDANPGNSPLKFKRILGLSKSPSTQPGALIAPGSQNTQQTPRIGESKLPSPTSVLKQDVFDLGSLLFISALGGLEIVDSGEFERISARSPSSCCVLHCGDEKASASTAPAPTRKGGALLLSQYFTSRRFSPQFLDFLCKCLRFNEADRPGVEELQRHPWISSKSVFKSAAVTLHELILISNQWRQAVPPIEYQGPAEKQLDRVCEAMAAVLPCCENFEEIAAAVAGGRTEKGVARELATDLGLELDNVWNKLMEVFKTICAQKDNNSNVRKPE